MKGVEEAEEEEEDEGYRWKEEKPPDGRSSGGGWPGGEGGGGGGDNSSGSSFPVSRESSGSESQLPLTRGKGRPRKRTLEGACMLCPISIPLKARVCISVDSFVCRFQYSSLWSSPQLQTCTGGGRGGEAYEGHYLHRSSGADEEASPGRPRWVGSEGRK